MTLTAAITIPAAPLLLPAASPAQPATLAAGVAALRADAADALGSLPRDVDAVLLVAAGDHGAAIAPEAADLSGYGLPQVRATIAGAPDLAAALDAALPVDVRASERGSVPGTPELLDGDLAVLALQVEAARPALPIAALTVPAAADPDRLERLAAAVADAVDASDHRVTVVAAGDLSAGRDPASPRYLVDGAVAWDEAAVAAVRAGDPAALAALGPGEAARVAARGWAPLVALLHLARRAGLSLTSVVDHAPRGVGQLVAS